MKKNIIMIVIGLLFFINSNAQVVVDISTFNVGNNNGKYFKDINNNFQNFLGTWEGSMSSTTTFRINLFKINKLDWSGEPEGYFKDFIGGSFQIIENAHTPNEVVLHNSIKYYPQDGTTSDNVMYFASVNGATGGGFMEDNCGNDGTESFTVRVVMEILNLGSTPLQMHWGAKRNMMFEGYHLSIPKDIVLTKQP